MKRGVRVRVRVRVRGDAAWLMRMGKGVEEVQGSWPLSARYVKLINILVFPFFLVLFFFLFILSALFIFFRL